MDDYSRMGIVALISSVITAAGTVMGFKPRVARLEADMDKKLNKETFKEVKSHIDTKFDGVQHQFEAQGREIGDIKAGVNKLLERRAAGRSGDE